MNLAAMYAQADRGSYYSHAGAADDIWAAINKAGRRVYLWIAKELSNYFIKWDTATIQTVIGQDEYTCPPDLATMIRFAERLPGETNYRRIDPTDVRSDKFAIRQFETIVLSLNLLTSDFVYTGPYLPGATAGPPANVPNIYKVRLAPTPQDVRQTEIIYAAKWVDIINGKGYNVIPDEGHGAQLDFAIADLVRANNDDLAQQYETQANQQLTEFLTFIRNRQNQIPMGQEPYVQDLD